MDPETKFALFLGVPLTLMLVAILLSWFGARVAARRCFLLIGFSTGCLFSFARYASLGEDKFWALALGSVGVIFVVSSLMGICGVNIWQGGPLDPDRD